MKPSAFTYHVPATITEAVDILSEYGDDAKILAGGQSLIPILSLRLGRYDHLVDINRISELVHIVRTGRDVHVGAMTRQRTAEVSSDIAEVCPLLAAALPLIGHFQIRNRGTIGGSLAHADPASELPAVAVALGATLELVGAGNERRVVPADAFFLGTWTTATAAHELLVDIHFPGWERPCGFAVEEVTRRQGDFALAGVACGIGLRENDVVRAAVVLFGVGDSPVRAEAAEEALVSGVTDIREVAELATRELRPIDDVHASAGYRRIVARELVARAVNRAKVAAYE